MFMFQFVCGRFGLLKIAITVGGQGVGGKIGTLQ